MLSYSRNQALLTPTVLAVVSAPYMRVASRPLADLGAGLEPPGGWWAALAAAALLFTLVGYSLSRQLS
ncbi:hypothetical protein [Aeropyrum camini]|nr:hypothetical protein [Aeropyrum camini]